MNLEVLKGHRKLQNLDGYHFHAARKIFPSFFIYGARFSSCGY